MNKNGFTLIELLIVVIIISTLASLSAPLYIRTVEKFKITEATIVMNDIKKAEEEVILRKGRYTEDFSELQVDIYDKDKNLCSGKICELKYFTIQIKVIGNSYQIIAQRNSQTTPPPSRYNPNYIYIYDSKTNSFLCNDAKCASDFV